jgi:hypothetical protein
MEIVATSDSAIADTAARTCPRSSCKRPATRLGTSPDVASRATWSML